jgi:hypothetical protein
MGISRFVLFRRFRFASFIVTDFWKLFGLVIAIFFVVKLSFYSSESSVSSEKLILRNDCQCDKRFGGEINLQKRLELSESIWRKSIERRQTFVKNQGGLSKVDPWKVDTNVYYWDYFVPSFNCPHSLQRIGRIGDGGKWICGIEVYENSRAKPCVLYSFGVANESTFEAEMLERTNCDIYAYDFSVDHMGYPLNSEDGLDLKVYFEPWALSSTNINRTFLTLGEIMRRNGHDWIDFLKIDIEGNEFACLDQIMEEFEDILPFGQLQMEIHVDHYGRGFKSVYKWWDKMESRGLRAFKSEVNHHSCVGEKTNPIAVEYSFLNTKGYHPLLHY